LLANTIAESHTLLLQLRRQSRPLAQLNDHGIADPHRPEQLRIGAQPSRRDPRVASVILGAGDAEAVAQTVKLLGVDRMHGKAAVLQSINHRAVWHLDRHRHGARRTCHGNQPVAQCDQACPAMRKRPLALYFAGAIENANLVLLRTPVDAGKPAYCFIGHDLCPRLLYEPPRRLPEPVLALKGATSYWASVAANPPGHKSNAGAKSPTRISSPTSQPPG
jgi:hypothetical protein